MTKYELSARANREIKELYLDGIEKFGLRQADRYLDELIHCFELLADNPFMGRKAEKIAPSARRHEHKSHIILYERTDDGVIIQAIVPSRSIIRLEL
ncbi:type II toxin-antitoxin system RelE/ParE family toxin [Rhizobium sp. LEGMi198b]|uniref:type II toxin-antitoxin system RelE/ParE family toxin n=1 Tax=Rhizobium sp. CB3171 TaxID=3039157 RepID=UPI0024B06909|nr:type II toxin-antitoxin system RelE/ParE family toxin [Rhizobium sp. CB3171]WFU00815.1 type II toxin-antitoxin system RelE/ParE family toxin [Rhizobium sp. CB3171]